MALEDIERLKEKVDKDPNSKLFIPLAEEYKKAGMFDEAIGVLARGLERQPEYMSARVSLGKIYLSRSMLEEARAEFEKVISNIPDNLYAHRKLAEIYRNLGEKDRAVKEFKTVLKLNPRDEWAVTSLSDIEGEPELPKEPEKAKSAETILSEAEELHEEEPFSFKSIFKEDVAVEDQKEYNVSEQPFLSIYDADPYISQGKYVEAMSIYRKLLSLEPEDVHVLQRVEELKALLKLLGKDTVRIRIRRNE
jgi:tetratricopeptide (TPR) repeat protein